MFLPSTSQEKFANIFLHDLLVPSIGIKPERMIVEVPIQNSTFPIANIWVALVTTTKNLMLNIFEVFGSILLFYRIVQKNYFVMNLRKRSRDLKFQNLGLPVGTPKAIHMDYKCKFRKGFVRGRMTWQRSIADRVEATASKRPLSNKTFINTNYQ